jgi:oligopeptide transport system substrate-binding protein
VLDPATASPVASLLYDIRGAKAFHGCAESRDQVAVRAEDNLTLVVELERPTAYFPHLLAFTVARAVPRHLVDAHGPSWTENARIATCGAFRTAHWEPGVELALVANDDFRGKRTGNVESLELRFDDPAALCDAYESGRLDVLALRRLPEQARWRMRQRYATDYLSIPTLMTQFVAFTENQAPFADPRVRQAFAHAVDQGTLADVTMRGDAFSATGGLLPVGMPGHAAGIALAFDPGRARGLLADAGYRDGEGFPTVRARSIGTVGVANEFLKRQWHDILGVEIRWEETASPTWDATRPPNILVAAWAADFPDPDNFLSLYLARFRRSGPEDQYRRALEAGRKMTDTAQRMALYGLADRILIEDALCVPLVYDRLQLLVRPWVKKLPTSAQSWWFWKDAIIAPHEAID